jgi:YegS/Rv2252/BmrU family lipid kinase
VRTRAIVNLRAGVAAQRALAALEHRGAAWNGLEIVLTERPGHARELARDAAQRGFDCVLSVGGDGTANEAAWGLLGGRTALGVLPSGSGNGLARTLRLSLDPARALAALRDAIVKPMDVGYVNERPFLNVAGTGFDAAVGRAFQERARQGARRGVLGYVRAGLAQVFSYRPTALVFEGSPAPLPANALLVTFANGPQYGGGAVIAPGARLDDGMLDVVVIEDEPRLRLLLQAPRLFLGGISSLGAYRRVAVKSLVVSGAVPLVHHCDGEPEQPLPRLEVRLKPRALNVLVPAATAGDPGGPFLRD